MTVEQFTELLDEKIFELAKEIRDEHGAIHLVISQDSTYSEGKITLNISEKG